MRLPAPRGLLSSALFPVLHGKPRELPGNFKDLLEGSGAASRASAVAGKDSESSPESHSNEDVQITLFACYALHYAGFEDVDEQWEWNPSLLALRAALEDDFERSLRVLADYPAGLTARELPGYLLRLGAPTAGPSLPQYMKDQGSIDHFRELVIHRSMYNVMEADPHSWGLPRVAGRAKHALVEIQADEYGNGLPGRMHSELFQRMMAELDLDPSYGRHVEQVPATSLAPINAASMFGLHRRLRGALLGNLAMIEIGSSFVNRCFSEGLKRLATSTASRWFYEEHIEADAAHEQIAAYNLCGSFAEQFPAELHQVLFGANATKKLGQMLDSVMVQSWAKGVSSLRLDALQQL